MTDREPGVAFTVSADFNLAHPGPGWRGREQSADVTVRRASVPDSLPAADAKGPAWEHAGDRLLIHHPGGLRFLIEGGTTICYEAKPGLTPEDVGLSLFGSPWAAVALQRGLLPLHASAVSRTGAVHAFTGASGAGKSTLAAALGRHGLPFFTDDLLLLEPTSDSADAGIRCYGSPGLKLFPDAATLMDATQLGEPVHPSLLKRWARPAHRSLPLVGRLRTLHVLSDRVVASGAPGSCSIEVLTGRRPVIALYDALYRKRQALAIVGRRRLFEWLLTAAARQVEVSIFHRPMSKRLFGQGVAHLAAALTEATRGAQ